MADALCPALEEIRLELEDASARASAMVRSLAPEALGLRPAPDSWSVAECLDHLTLSADAFAPAIREALAEGRSRNLLSSSPVFRMDLLARLLGWWLEPPYKMKSKTGAAFAPETGRAADALPDFLQRQEQIAVLLRDADGLAIDRLKIQSPFARKVRYSVYSAFRLIAVHERRHLWQAEQVARRLGGRR